MKCAVAIVLALLGLVAASPVPGLGLGSHILHPVSTVISHGVTLPVVTAPVIRHVIAAPIYTSYGWGHWGHGLGHHWGGWSSHGGWH